MAKPNVISKDALIKCAKESLANNGINKFTLKSVAEVAGVTQGTIYYHFRTKEQLLLAIVQDISKNSWADISQKSNQYIISEAIASAKNRCSYDSYFHKLFSTLLVSSFNNEEMRMQLGEIVLNENNALTQNLSKFWPKSPIDGVSLETWGVLLTAIVDGLALQALLQKDFPVEKTYKEVEQLFNSLSNLLYEENQ